MIKIFYILGIFCLEYYFICLFWINIYFDFCNYYSFYLKKLCGVLFSSPFYWREIEIYYTVIYELFFVHILIKSVEYFLFAMVFDSTIYLLIQKSSSFSFNFCSQNDENTLSSLVIANLHLMKNNHNSAIFILLSVEYDKLFHLPTQDLSSVTSMSSSSDNPVVMAHAKTTKSKWKRRILYSSDLLLSVNWLS